MIKTYKDLIVWQKGIDLVKFVYQMTRRLPEAEKFGLISQLQRASVSVPANIAEGWGRETKAYYVNFLRISKGSLAELDTLATIAHSLNYLEPDLFVELNNKIEEVSRMLNALIRSLTKANTPT